MRRASGRCWPAWIRTKTQLIQRLAVHVGARVAALAAPIAVMVSQTVKDLVAGSGLTFEDFGEHELKGVPDCWHPYHVVG
jgi:class 3 adenylate cyclase